MAVTNTLPNRRCFRLESLAIRVLVERLEESAKRVIERVEQAKKIADALK